MCTWPVDLVTMFHSLFSEFLLREFSTRQGNILWNCPGQGVKDISMHHSFKTPATIFESLILAA